MLYKLLAWLILAASTITGGAVLGGGRGGTQTGAVTVPERPQIVAPGTITNSLPFILPARQSPLNTETNQGVEGRDGGTPGEIEEPDIEVKQPPEATDLTESQSSLCGEPPATDQPQAERIAQEFGVTVQEVMSRFCEKYGFGEIELAYSIAATKGVSAAEVFAKRDAGEGWGQIMHDYSLNGNPKRDMPEPNRGKGKNH